MDKQRCQAHAISRNRDPAYFHSTPQLWWLRGKAKHKNYENKHSESRATSADDRSGRFPDLFGNRRTKSRGSSKRQLCRPGDVRRDDQCELTQPATRLERRIKIMTDDPSQADLDNHSNQCNPNNDEYWHSRGEGEDD